MSKCRLSFDFDDMEAMIGFFDTFLQTNNPKYIKASMKYHPNNADDNETIQHFLVSTETIGRKRENIIPMTKGKKNE